MSENPNSTVCGNCSFENPPGVEYCRECGAALTMAAELARADGDKVLAPDAAVDSADATDPATNPFSTD
jgi:ribosomal protein L40E